MDEAPVVGRAAARVRRVRSNASVAPRRRSLISSVSVLAAAVVVAACGGGSDAAPTTTTPTSTTIEQCAPGLATVLAAGDSVVLDEASGV